jgi:4-hydroxy-tetrahydrodipicolinate synthase
VAQARAARRTGAAGLLVFPPRAFGGEGLPADTVVEYHRAIIRASELPVILFHRPAQFGGVVYPAETLRLLAALEGVAGLKEASFDATRFIQIVRVNRTFPRPLKILTGNDTFIYESYLLGADGALLGMGAMATAPQIAMLEAVRRGDLVTGAALRNRLDPLCQAIYAAPLRNYRVRMKEALVFQGILKNAVVRAPLPSASDDERATIRRALSHAGLL